MNVEQLAEKMNGKYWTQKNRYGQEIRIKDIPDGGRKADGDFDPRVLQTILAQSAEQPHPRTLEEIRARMGWPNRDLTNGSVPCEEKLLSIEGRQIRVLVCGRHQGEKKPCILFFHGGGFFGGSVECVRNPCKALAQFGNMVVVAVDYALAPEHPFPQGLSDCYDAVKYVWKNAKTFGADSEKIGVAGDSAGGNLAAACCVLDRDTGNGIIRFQALVYPVVNVAELPNDFYRWDIEEYDIRQHEDLIRKVSAQLGKDTEKHIQRYLAGNASLAADPLVSPLFADASGLAPALIINAEYDFLRLEGEAYGRKLTAAGVRAVNIRYRGMDHAFMDKLGDYPQAEDCMREIARGFQSVLNEKIL